MAFWSTLSAKTINGGSDVVEVKQSQSTGDFVVEINGEINGRVFANEADALNEYNNLW